MKRCFSYSRQDPSIREDKKFNNSNSLNDELRIMTRTISSFLIVVLAKYALLAQSLRMRDLFRPRMKTALQSVEEAKLGWDSHKAIESIPDSLVRTIDGNESMRRKFENLCRTAQVSITSSCAS